MLLHTAIILEHTQPDVCFQRGIQMMTLWQWTGEKT